MDLLRENRTVVIVIALLVIAYLLWDVEVVRNLRMTVMGQWNRMGNIGRVVVVLLLAYLAYYWWSRE